MRPNLPSPRPWLSIQIALGIVLVGVPVLWGGAVSLAFTIPTYVVLTVLSRKREAQVARAAERETVAKELKSLVNSLATLTEGAHSHSPWGILRDLEANGQFKSQMHGAGNAQAVTLLIVECERLFKDTHQLKQRVEDLHEDLSDAPLSELVSDTREALIAYRQLVDQFLRFLADTERSGEAVQNKAPFSVRVHRELADDYDRLMDDARRFDLRCRRSLGVQFLDTSHLGRFPRVFLLG